MVVRLKIFFLTYIACSATAGKCDAQGISQVSDEATVYTYLGPGDENSFTRALLSLVLDKTIDDFGPYHLSFPPKMNEKRALVTMRTKQYPNAFRQFETTEEVLSEKSLTMIPFPVYLGAYGYRVCFVNKNVLETFGEIRSLDDLSLFTQGTVRGWYDTTILRASGVTVIETPNLQSVYRQVGVNRMNAFCRATIEVRDEASIWEEVDTIELDQRIFIYYPFPFFYYTHSEDNETAERITVGLMDAWEDGSLIKLWRSHFENDFNHGDLLNRHQVSLHNPSIEKLNVNVSPYLISLDALQAFSDEF